MVEPVDPAQPREFEVVRAAPRPVPVDEFGLVEPVDGLGQGVVIAVRDGPDGGLQAGLGELFGVADRGVLLRFKGSKQHRPVGVTVVGR